jgi:hypothetical protein
MSAKYGILASTLSSIPMSANLLLFFLLVSTMSVAEDQIRSNQTILIESITEEISRVIYPSDSTYYVSLEPNNPSATLQLTHNLVNSGFTITSDIDNYKHRIIIQTAGSNELTKIGRNQYQRTLNVEVYLTISDQSGIISFSHHFLIKKSDQFKHSSPEILEGNWQPTKFSEIKQTGFRSFLTKIGQPVIIASAIGTTIYLLYNVRSQ